MDMDEEMADAHGESGYEGAKGRVRGITYEKRLLSGLRCMSAGDVGWGGGQTAALNGGATIAA